MDFLNGPDKGFDTQNLAYLGHSIERKILLSDEGTGGKNAGN